MKLDLQNSCTSPAQTGLLVCCFQKNLDTLLQPLTPKPPPGSGIPEPVWTEFRYSVALDALQHLAGPLKSMTIDWYMKSLPMDMSNWFADVTLPFASLWEGLLELLL